MDDHPGFARMLDRVVRRLVWAVAPREVILFGSLGKGIANRHSDLDLLVITDAHPDAALTAAAFDATRGALKCDVVLRDPAGVAAETADRYGFLAGVVAGGRSLYLRPGVGSCCPKACPDDPGAAGRPAVALVSPEGLKDVVLRV